MPCTVCKGPVHHMCSNELCRYHGVDLENIAVRLCSTSCIESHVKTASLAVEVPCVAVVAAKTMLDLQIDSGLEPETDCSQEMAVDASQTSSLSEASDRRKVDVYGIPVEISHYRQARARDEVWSVAHVLDKPYAITDDDDAEVFTHVCLLCAETLTAASNAPSDAWEGALRKYSTTSNVKDHLAAIYEKHPLGKVEAAKKAQRTKRQHDEAVRQAIDTIQAIEDEVPPKPRGTLPKLWGPNQKQLNVFVSQWLIHDGIPYNAVTTAAFKWMLKRVTVNPKASVLAPATYRMQLDAAFDDFLIKTKKLLQQEFTAALGSPFLNLHHDSWTTGSDKTGVVGISVRFIDEKWRFRTIALLATVSNDSHSFMRMKTLISSRIRDLYDINIDAMAQFTASDTAAAARKISRLFEDSVQTDCSMHSINLCLLYAMGMREHTEAVVVKDATTGEMRKVRRICTEGGAFSEGAALIKKIRAINNYFNSPQRAGRFAKIQQQYGLPGLACIVDCDTRVGSTVTLFTRSIVNFTAFKCYFEQCKGDDDPAVFNNLPCEDWHLLTEMEAIVRAMANLARAEVQRDDMLASELTVLIKIASDQLNTSIFNVCTLDVPRTVKTMESSFPRHRVPFVALSAPARTCVARLRAQVQKRVLVLRS